MSPPSSEKPKKLGSAPVRWLPLLGMLLSCRSDLWIPNTFGAVSVRDFTGDGHDDCAAWFVGFGDMQAAHLAILEGRTGECHLNAEGATTLQASLLPDRLVISTGGRTLSRNPKSPGHPVTLPPTLDLWDVPHKKLLATQRLASSAGNLVVKGDSVVFNGTAGALWVDLQTNTIRTGERAEGSNPAALVDQSALTAPGAASGFRPADVGLKQALGRDLKDGTWLVVGSDERDVTVVARIRAGQAAGPQATLRRQPLTTAGAPSGWVTGHAAVGPKKWFIPYAQGDSLRLAALNSDTLALAWTIELRAPFRPSPEPACSMSAGRDIVAIAYSTTNACDTLAILEAETGKLVASHRRGS